MKFYAGIGSRETPRDVLDLMEALAEQLADEGWHLRTGGAPGADQAFERGAVKVDGEALRLYLPWPGFEQRASVLCEARLKNGARPYSERTCYDEPEDWTYLVAAKHHPAWASLKQGAKKLHSRNVHQIAGHREEDERVARDAETALSSFVICWTKDGQASGGTGQAIRIAEAYGIPVRNLHDAKTREAAERFVRGGAA